MKEEIMSNVALKLYQGLTDIGEDKERAKVLASAFEELEYRYPEVKDLATGEQLSEKSLLLQKEIREIDSHIKDTESHMKEIESHLQKDMKEIESNLQKEIHQGKMEMMRHMSRQTWLYFSGLSVLTAVLSVITAFIVHYLGR